MSERAELPSVPIQEGGQPASLQLRKEDFARGGIIMLRLLASQIYNFIKKREGQDVTRGGDFLLAGGLNVQIFKPLEIWDKNGKHFEDFELMPRTVALNAADADFGRIDIIYALMEEDIEGPEEMRHVKYLPTGQEGDVSTYNTRRNRLTITYLPGTPSANPAPPDLPSSFCVPLYHFSVPAGALALSVTSVTDKRFNFWSLEEVCEQIKNLIKIINLLKENKHRHPADWIDQAPGSPSYVTLGHTTQDALDAVALMLKPPKPIDPPPGGTGSGASVRPEILTPEIVSYDPLANKLRSSGAVIGGVPSVRIPIPASGSREIQFQTGIFSINDNNFADKSLHPRFINTDPDQNTNSITHEEFLTLNNVTVTQSSGGGDWTNLNAPATIPQSSWATGRRSVARDDRYVELFGGSDLGDSSWFTFDTQAKSYEARAFVGAIPIYPIEFASPCGGGRALIMTLDNNQDSFTPGARHWFLVDCTSGATEEILTGPGGPNDPLALRNIFVIGDLIETNVVMLIVNHAGPTPGTLGYKYYFFHADNKTFELFAPVGGFLSGTMGINGSHLCFYRQGQALYFQDEREPIRKPLTAVFNYATRSFTVLSVAPPVNPVAIQQFLPGAVMANINGKIQLMWAWWNAGVTQWVSYVHEFDGKQWNNLQTGLPGNWFPQFVSTIKSGFPQGNGYFFGGQTQALKYETAAWGFATGGIVGSLCGGSAGISLAPTTTSATIRLPNFQLPANFPVAHVRISLRGQNLDGRVRVLESFDGGLNMEEIPIDQNYAVIHTSPSPNRQLFLEMTGTANIKPCISSTYEIFENQTGGGLGMLYFVFDCPPGVNYLFMNDKGLMTVEPAVAQTNRSKALLLECTKNGLLAPGTFDYINKARIERKYEGGPQAGGVSPTFRLDFAVVPDFRQSWRSKADGNVTLLGDSTIVFNGNVTVVGLANGEGYRVHLCG